MTIRNKEFIKPFTKEELKECKCHGISRIKNRKPLTEPWYKKEREERDTTNIGKNVIGWREKTEITEYNGWEIIK